MPQNQNVCQTTIIFFQSLLTGFGNVRKAESLGVCYFTSKNFQFPILERHFNLTNESLQHRIYSFSLNCFFDTERQLPLNRNFHAAQIGVDLHLIVCWRTPPIQSSWRKILLQVYPHFSLFSLFSSGAILREFVPIPECGCYINVFYLAKRKGSHAWCFFQVMI